MVTLDMGAREEENLRAAAPRNRAGSGGGLLDQDNEVMGAEQRPPSSWSSPRDLKAQDTGVTAGPPREGTPHLCRAGDGCTDLAGAEHPSPLEPLGGHPGEPPPPPAHQASPGLRKDPRPPRASLWGERGTLCFEIPWPAPMPRMQTAVPPAPPRGTPGHSPRHLLGQARLGDRDGRWVQPSWAAGRGHAGSSGEPGNPGARGEKREGGRQERARVDSSVRRGI